MRSSSFDLTPEEIRRLGYMAADAVADHRAGLISRPVFGKVGAGAALFDEPPPEEGQPIEKTLAFAREHILPFPMRNSHPRFFGFINAAADPVGIAVDYPSPISLLPNHFPPVANSDLAESDDSRAPETGDLHREGVVGAAVVGQVRPDGHGERGLGGVGESRDIGVAQTAHCYAIAKIVVVAADVAAVDERGAGGADLRNESVPAAAEGQVRPDGHGERGLGGGG